MRRLGAEDDIRRVARALQMLVACSVASLAARRSWIALHTHARLIHRKDRFFPGFVVAFSADRVATERFGDPWVNGRGVGGDGKIDSAQTNDEPP